MKCTCRAGLSVVVIVLATLASADNSPRNIVRIDATNAVLPHPAFRLNMGGRSANGHEIHIENNQYIVLDGKPWLPVLGEFHFSRYPEQYWEEELLKMKAGGLDIVATYLFWNHHEEVEGQFDWSGQRNLRRFVQLCASHGLYVFLRIGPWSHGEVRNGGFPDWLIARVPSRRRNDPQYLSYVRRYFGQIGEQVHDLLWKDGGPIIGIQFENEYYERGPDAGAAHVSELKKIASESGIEAPLYTVTGWGNPDFPAGEVIPVFGGYPDNFWESNLNDSPPSGYYLFESQRDNGEMGGPTPSQVPVFQYPYFMAEAGGGIQVAYHRRPVIYGDDVAAITLSRLGSGAELYGYYMFHGGANPEGRLTTLQESIASDHVYELPVVSYDFQAPLGEFGQIRESFRAIKALHLFLHAFGNELAPTASFLPDRVPANAADTSVIRAAARVRENRGFLFVNNYSRNYQLPDHNNVQFQLKLSTETVLVPDHPVEIHSGAYFIWPVNLDLAGITLEYATAQPLTVVHDGKDDYYFFFAQPGIDPEFVFEEHTVASLEPGHAIVTRGGNKLRFSRIQPGTDKAFCLKTPKGHSVCVVVLTEGQAHNLWKASLAEKEQVFLTPADVFFESNRIHFRARETDNLRVSVFPEFTAPPAASARLRQRGHDGLFASYAATMQPKEVRVRWERVRDASPSVPVKKGQYNAMAPSREDFERAGVWRISLPEDALDGLSDLYLRIKYVGDVARIYAGARLLTDDFYKGTVWEVGLKRFATEALGQSLELKIMPLRKDSPIYMPRSALPKFPPSGEVAEVSEITVSPEYEVRVDVHPDLRGTALNY
jgi:hypothetical protein